MFSTIQDGNRIARAQAAFEERIRQAASRSGQISLGHQGGGNEAMAHAIAPLNFWTAFADLDTRYWNALGMCRLIEIFDEEIPEHKEISELKKVDFVLWQSRN